MPSHVKCRGQLEGCLRTAHRGTADGLCTPCREKKRGQERRGSFRSQVRLSSAIDDVVGPRLPGVDKELWETRIGIATENVIADAETGGHGVLTPVDRFALAESIAQRSGDERKAIKYLNYFTPGQVKTNDPNSIPYEWRQEIREVERRGAATRDEILETYLLTDECLDKILAEPEPSPPEEIHMPVAEPEPEAARKPRGKHTPEHLAKMREARWAKHRAQQDELERLRAAVETSGRDAEPVAPATLNSPSWRVTILQPTEVVVEASTLTEAMATTRNLYRVADEHILGIVRT